MRENIQYRIKEVKGIFRVQIYAYEEKSVFWNKRKKKWSWEETNAWGGSYDDISEEDVKEFEKCFSLWG